MRDTERSLPAPREAGDALDRILLVSTYELGHVPAGLTQPAAWLRRAGHRVATLDLAVEAMDPERIRAADAIAFSIPMHTATRLALDAIAEVRARHPGVRLAAYGLYAPGNADALARLGVEATFAGEIEADLVRWAAGDSPSDLRTVRPHDRAALLVSDHHGLPGIEHYASVVLPDGSRRPAGYVEASRGCKHRCRHCPVVPIYDGRFRIVDVETIVRDIAGQVASGAAHISFGDPDFGNGPRHAHAVLDAMERHFPEVSFDVTAKVEHLLALPELTDRLEQSACLFVTTAVESVDDRVLGWLDKGHSRADFRRLATDFQGRGLSLSPTFIPFTPWTTLEGYRDLLETLIELDLVAAVAPVQLAIRLLVPAGSLLLGLPALEGRLGAFDEVALSHPWSYGDARVDALERAVRRVVESAGSASRGEVFAELWRIVHEALDRAVPELRLEGLEAVPRSSEDWYCCAEPACDRPSQTPSC